MIFLSWGNYSKLWFNWTEYNPMYLYMYVCVSVYVCVFMYVSMCVWIYKLL